MANMVKFEGQAPFILPAAKSAQADVSERSVAVTLYSQVEGHGPGLVSIAVHMPRTRDWPPELGPSTLND
jgi:hypothetical protein